METRVISTTKTCKECGRAKPMEAFPKNKGMRDGHINTCKVCNATYLRGYHRRRMEEDPEGRRAAQRVVSQRRSMSNRRQIILAKDRPCVDCGIKYPSYVMDLHHRDTATKVKAVSQLVQRTSNYVAAEIAKCDVLCANCHRVRHHAARHGDTASLTSETL